MKWEWLFLLLFYGLSMLIKRKQQKNINKEIEEDPDWDFQEEKASGKPVDFLETFLESQGLIKETIRDDTNEINLDEKNQEEELEVSFENQKGKEYPDIENFSSNKNKKNSLDYISNIKNDRRIQNRRLEDQTKKTKNPKYSYNRLNKIFHVMSPLKQSIVLKEILDKPISLRSKR